MKLKFEKETQDVINAIAQLPDEAGSPAGLAKPNQLIGVFDKVILGDKANRNAPSKHWAKLRRQLSFLYEIVNIGAIAGKKVSQTGGEESLKESYRMIVTICKKIVAGTSLDHPMFVRLALSYGVLHLSDHEIQKLIDGNNV